MHKEESDSARPIGVTMRAFSHGAIYADILIERRVLPPFLVHRYVVELELVAALCISVPHPLFPARSGRTHVHPDIRTVDFPAKKLSKWREDAFNGFILCCVAYLARLSNLKATLR